MSEINQFLKLIYCIIIFILLGTAHFEELGYLFYPHITKVLGLSPAAPDSEDYRVINCLTQMWTDFAKTGYYRFKYFL